MERDEFAAQVTALERSLYCVARAYLHSETDCEDALQNAILRAWEKLDSLREERYFKTWLTRILINCCQETLRRRRRETVGEVPEIPAPPQDGDAMLWEALTELDEKYRIMLVLFYRDGYEIKEISRILHLPQGTVKNRLFRARKYLKEELCREEALV